MKELNYSHFTASISVRKQYDKLIWIVNNMRTSPCDDDDWWLKRWRFLSSINSIYFDREKTRKMFHQTNLCERCFIWCSNIIRLWHPAVSCPMMDVFLFCVDRSFNMISSGLLLIKRRKMHVVCIDPFRLSVNHILISYWEEDEVDLIYK